jgi:hypothetical protein
LFCFAFRFFPSGMNVCMLYSVDSLPDTEVFGLEILYPVLLPFAF